MVGRALFLLPTLAIFSLACVKPIATGPTAPPPPAPGTVEETAGRVPLDVFSTIELATQTALGCPGAARVVRRRTTEPGRVFDVTTCAGELVVTVETMTQTEGCVAVVDPRTGGPARACQVRLPDSVEPSSGYTGSAPPVSGGGRVHVRGYYRGGRYVRPYTRRRPR